jgi:hypothetical protein
MESSSELSRELSIHSLDLKGLESTLSPISADLGRTLGERSVKACKPKGVWLVG